MSNHVLKLYRKWGRATSGGNIGPIYTSVSKELQGIWVME